MKQNPTIDSQPDAVLADRAQQGNADAASSLIVRYTPLVTLRAKSFLGTGLELEDLAQEGMIGLLSAIYTYRFQEPAAFKTYACRCIDNKILSAVKAYHRDKNRPLNYHASLEEWDRESESQNAMDPQEIIIQQEHQSLRQKQISTLLSAFEQEVLELHLKGNSYQEISDCLHCTTKAVDNALQRVRRKLHAAQI